MRRLLALVYALILASPAAGATTTIQADNLKWLSRFYEAELGLTLWYRDLERGRVVFEISGDFLVIEDRGASGDSTRQESQILLPVADLDRERARLRASNIDYWERINSSGQADGIICRDPEGNSIWYLPASGRGLAESGESLGPPADSNICWVGRTGLIAYGGVCGALIGASAAIGLGADEPEWQAISAVLGAFLGAIASPRDSSSLRVSIGRFATLILAGNYGFWQGLGWSEATDATERTAALTAAASGMTCIYLSSEILDYMSVSTCNASIIHTTTYWGTWFGFVGASMAGSNFGDNRDRVLSSMLWGSSAGLAAGVLWALNLQSDPGRIRDINIWGIIGTAVGFGLAEAIGVDDMPTYYCYPAIGGALGLTAASLRPRGSERETSALAFDPRLAPAISAGPDGGIRFTLLRASF